MVGMVEAAGSEAGAWEAQASPRWTVLLAVGLLLLTGLFVAISIASPSDGTATGAARSRRDGEDVDVVARQSALRSGDVVIAIDGRPTVDRSLPDVRKGDTLTYLVRRGDQTLEVNVPIGDHPVREALARH